MKGSSEIIHLAWVAGKAMVRLTVPKVVSENLYKQYTEFSILFLLYSVVLSYALFKRLHEKTKSYTIFQIKRPLSPSLEVSSRE